MSDGLTTKLHKGFWNKVGQFVVRSLNYVYKARELSTPKNNELIPVSQKM